MIGRTTILIYGVLCYAAGFSALVYQIGFLGGFLTPTTIDGPQTGSLATAISVNIGLCLLFAVQHSLMARPAFKRQLTRWIPKSVERSTYLLATAVALGTLYWLWRPLGGVVWNVDIEPLRWLILGCYALGWALIFGSSFLIDHFDLFGLRQVWLAWRGEEYTERPFGTPGLYAVIRHPIYTGVLLTSWAAPTMGVARLLYAVTITAYVLIAIRLEERDLVNHLGDDYSTYRQRVPALLPRVFGSRAS